jgi:hypothetical protein
VGEEALCGGFCVVLVRLAFFLSSFWTLTSFSTLISFFFFSSLICVVFYSLIYIVVLD